MSDQLSMLYNDLMGLCEVRGELSTPEENEWLETKIAELNLQIQKLESGDN
jgi:hypothetical protein